MSADPGDLVPSFGTGGVVKTDFAGGHDAAIAVAITLTGKIIAAGSATIPGKGTDFALACYDGNGNLDPTFGNGGKVTADFFGGNDGARGVVLQRDQKIVLSGFATNAGERQFALARFNPDGSPDTTFDQDGKVVLDLGSTSEAFNLALQPDSKIVAVGDSRPQNSLDFTVVRLNQSDGSSDATFGNGGIVRIDFGNADRAINLAIDEENIFVAGIVARTQTDSDFGIVRLNISNGSLNNAFDGDGRATLDFFGGPDGAQSIILRPLTFDVPENHLILGGFATNETQDFALAAYNYNGIRIDGFFGVARATDTFDFDKSRDQIFSLIDLPDRSFAAAGWAGDGDNFDLGVAIWTYRPTRRWEFSDNYTYDTSSGGNNVAYDAGLYEDTVITAGTGLNPVTGNDDFILTKHEDKPYAEIIKRAPATPVLRGNEITYTFEITNLTDNELSLIVTDVLPVGVTFETSQNPGWEILSEFGASPIIERPLTVPGGQTSFIALRVRADQSGILKNKATLLLPHPDHPVFGYVTPTFLSSSEVESEVKEPLEGDVTSDGLLSNPDSRKALEIAAGLVEVKPGNEFRSADTAERSTKGDADLNLKDAVQTGRYVGGLDPETSAGGPTDSTSGSSQFSPHKISASLGSEAGQTRTLRALNTSFVAGQNNTLEIELDALGGENAVAFSLNYDPGALSFISLGAGSATPGAEMVVNSTQAAGGRIGVVLALPAGRGLQAGARRIATVSFNIAPGNAAVATPVSFGDQIIARQLANANADDLTLNTLDAVVTIVRTAAHVSAASFSGATLAGESIVAAFGAVLATSTEVAASVPLPTSLAGTTVNVRDSAGFDRLASLFFVSAGQINYAMPVGVALGAATVTITSGSGAISVGQVMIEAVAPGVFAANASGQGVAAAQVLRVKADGAQIFEQTAVFDTTTGQFIAAPIDLGPPGEQVFLVLYGTGIRFRSALSAVQLSVGGTNLEALFAGAAGGFVGLDQINALLPRTLAGRGAVQMALAVDGKPANVVEVSVR